MKILLVDDEPAIINGLKQILTTQLLFPCKTASAHSGKDALKLSASFLPDLVITDIVMPDYTGLELIQMLKEKQYCSYFIILSGHDNFSFAQTALRHGAIDYLLKPVDNQMLIERCYETYKSLPEAYSRIKDHALPDLDYFHLDIREEEFPPSLTRVIAYMRTNYMHDISLNQIGEELFLHPSYISSLINKHTGHSFPYLLEHLRLTKAAEFLLYEKNISISEISYLVGYNTDRRLYSAFSKRLGCTPTQFKNKYSLFPNGNN